MVNELINLLIDLAVNPDSQISEEILKRHQITDDDLRSALLNKDKHALQRFLDPKRLTLTMTNNSTIFAIRGDVETEPSEDIADATDDITFVLQPEPEDELTLVNIYKPDQIYKAHVVSGELVGHPASPAKEVGGGEEDAPSPPSAYQS